MNSENKDKFDFLEIALNRQSCRSYNPKKDVEKEKLMKCLEAVRLAPSACNGQPYHFHVITKEKCNTFSTMVKSKWIGLNTHVSEVPCFVVISEDSYNFTEKIGSIIKDQNYRLEDIGIAAAYFTSEAHTQGLSTCIMGWFDQDAIKKFLKTSNTIRLVISVGYKNDDDVLRPKSRKKIEDLVTWV